MKETLLSIGGLFGAAGASACCIFPLGAVLAGVAGPWLAFFTALSPYQPYFITASVVFLGWGFWAVYRQPKPESPGGEVCKPHPINRLAKPILWAASGLVALSVVLQYALPILLNA